MPSDPQPVQTHRFPAWINVAIRALGLLAVGASALDLSAYGMAHYLNSDFFTPYFFCADLLSGSYPLKGWTLSASPYFVPDHLVLGSLLAGLGPSGIAYALFTPVFYLGMIMLAGLCVRTAVGRTGPALMAALMFGNLLLAMRALPQHARCLWWIGAPTCHGGVLLLGFAYLWTLGAGLRRGSVGRLPVGLFCLGFLGLLSDSLFLFQVLLPAGAALFFLRQKYPAFVRWLRWQAGCGAAALLGAQFFKPVCKLADWFYFSRIIRVAPIPANQWHAFAQFVSDVPRLLRDDWGFALVAVAAAGSLFFSWRNRRIEHASGDPRWDVLDFYRLFCAASLAIMLPLPILSCGWKDENNVRYLFNWLVLPGFLLTLETTAKLTSSREGQSYRRTLAGMTAVFVVSLSVAAGSLRQATLRFPYPDDIAALDTVLQRRGLKHGLAQYWDAKNVTALSHAGVELRQIRANGEPYFWDNNVFAYYQRNADGTFSWPDYRYILTDLLDEPAVLRAFGEPQTRESAGRYQVWIYGDDGARRIREALEPKVREKLGPRTASATFLP